MKKLMSVLLTLTLLCACVPLGAIPAAAATSGTTGDCTWSLDDNGHLTISGNGAMGDYYMQSLPWDNTITSVTVEYGVTEIGSCAFIGCSLLNQVTISNSVTHIGLWAFLGCSSLTQVMIPDSVTYIGERVFASCDSLTSIIVSDGNQAFSSVDGVLFNKDQTVLLCYPAGKGGPYTIPEGVNKIDWEAFAGCKLLTQVTIPNSVTFIGEAAFEQCDSLVSLLIPDSVTTIEGSAFFSCDSLKSVIIGRGMTTIQWSMFAWCEALTAVTIPSSVTMIDEDAFHGCSGLTDIYYDGTEMDRTMISIDSGNDYLLNAVWHYSDVSDGGVISGTTGDCTWTLDGTQLTISGNGAMGDYDNCGPWGEKITSVIIEDGVTTIGECAFYYCNSLTLVTVPNSVTTIKKHAFEECTSLISVIIPNSVITIEGFAFNSCTSLALLVIGDSVTTIGESAFCACLSLTSVTIPDSVTTIGVGVFFNCHALRSVTIGNSITSIGWCAFSNCDSITDVYYCGTEVEQKAIFFDEENDPLLNATWHYIYSHEIPGDANEDGKVNVRDLGLLQQHLNGWNVTITESACDVNGDGKVNVRDLGLLQQYLNGWDVELK